MDIGTIFGVIGGLVLIIMAILINGTAFGAYLNLPSAVMVIGGSYAALMVANPVSRMLGIMRYVRLALRTKNWNEEKLISDLITFSDRARREGLLALEDNVDQIDDEFMRRGIQLVVDGTDPQIIKNILYTDLNNLQDRHEVGDRIFSDWGKIAPAFGLIGTLIGLIAMLANLEDESSIGTGLALALVTTLYGALFANLVLIPMRSKLNDRHTNELRVKEIIVEGVLSIQSGDNPRILLEKLISFLPPRRRTAAREEAERG